MDVSAFMIWYFLSLVAARSLQILKKRILVYFYVFAHLSSILSN